MIRSLLYLDEQKLYSLSSQVLEGVTEYLHTEKNSAVEESETQKGPIASGRVLADAIKNTTTSIERRVLHDHAFALFEDKLISSELVSEIGDSCDSSSKGLKSFVRVSARARFVDAAALNHLLEIFNRLGEAVAYVTNHEAIQAAQSALDNAKEGGINKGKYQELLRVTKPMLDAGLIAKSSGFYQDPKFLENLSMITKFGFSDQFDVQQVVGDTLYTSPLKRNCLRESESLMARKYSKSTERELVVLGVVTQTNNPTASNHEFMLKQPQNMRIAFSNMIDHIASLESTISGKLKDEVVIDPIAVYVAL